MTSAVGGGCRLVPSAVPTLPTLYTRLLPVTPCSLGSWVHGTVCAPLCSCTFFGPQKDVRCLVARQFPKIRRWVEGNILLMQTNRIRERVAHALRAPGLVCLHERAPVFPSSHRPKNHDREAASAVIQSINLAMIGPGSSSSSGSLGLGALFFRQLFISE